MLNQAASTRCSGDNKEKLARNIRSEYASDFCHDRKSAFTSGTPSDFGIMLPLVPVVKIFKKNLGSPGKFGRKRGSNF